MANSLYLIPSFIGIQEPDVLPANTLSKLHEITCFIVEREKTARAFLKAIDHPTPQNAFIIHELDKHHNYEGFKPFFDQHIPLHNIGVISEAGLPAVADPGSTIVRHAHDQGIEVKPLSGSSSIFLALMASGLDGQHFSFNGYLPIQSGDKVKRLKHLEREAMHSTQIFMETPYRNNAFLEFLIKHLNPGTLLCVAADIETPSQYIRTQSVQNWNKTKVDLHKRPCIYLIKS